MLYKATTYTIATLLLTIFIYKIGLRVSFSDFKDYAGVLINVAGMVFTIMGIWIAFLYPNALSRLANPDKVATADFSESFGETKRLEALVGSILKSALVVSLLLAIHLIRTILSSSDLYKQNGQFLSAVALASAITLTCLQFEAVFHVMWANVMFLNDLYRKRQAVQADQDV